MDKMGSMAGPSHSKGEGEGMHVCVTCGRTDSPEWRKGPLGPKTLCNVSRASSHGHTEGAGCRLRDSYGGRDNVGGLPCCESGIYWVNV